MMNERLAVDGDNQLSVIRETGHQPRNKAIRFAASLLSYLFHPLFVPVIIAWFLINVQPQFFASGERNHLIVLIRFFVSYSFFPLVTILLLKGLGFISSIFLKTQKERIIPYMACGIYYFWMAYVFRHQPEFAPQVVQLTMAIFIASSIGLIANIYMKVSMHAMSMGVGLAFITLLSLDTAGFTLYMSLALLLTGMVCTARMIVSDHTPAEIYMGLLVGIVSMLIAVWADGILP